jgi:predicted molibdopterin-dependent oxidoreductase YjgC
LEKKNSFFVYTGNFFDNGANLSNLIIPNYTFFEDDFEFINIEGKIRKSLRVLTSNNNLISDFDFFNFLNIFKELYIENNFSFIKK